MTAKETANYVLDHLVHFNQNDKDNYLRRLIDLILKEDIETQALRDWKAKARPFLEREAEYLSFLTKDCKYSEPLKEKLNELTELLGGD
jgi:hypothetical protein